jgi:hypothetical protein
MDVRPVLVEDEFPLPRDAEQVTLVAVRDADFSAIAEQRFGIVGPYLFLLLCMARR